jgi:predicted NUDIX family phosphoesterase
MLDVQTERVLVVPTEIFHRLGHFQGFRSQTEGVAHYLEELLDPRHISYRPRSEMEVDPSFKQLIPYCIFRYSNPQAGTMIFQYTRGKGQGEGRLHSKRSVGIGGHISSDDAVAQAGGNAYLEGLRRELEEEVSIDSPYTQQCVGLINDDNTEVGKVHLGVVHVFDLERPAVEPRESEIIESGFLPVGTLLGDLERFESWSRICLEALFGAKK